MQTLAHPNPLTPCSAPNSDFLIQCAALGQTIFGQLQDLILKPASGEKNPEDAAAIRNLETASRILKRIQETYLAAQKAIKANSTPENDMRENQIVFPKPHENGKAAHAPIIATTPAPSAPSNPTSSKTAMMDLMQAVDALDETNAPANQNFSVPQANKATVGWGRVREMQAQDHLVPKPHSLVSNAPERRPTIPLSEKIPNTRSNSASLTDECLPAETAVPPASSSNILYAAQKPHVPFRPPLTKNQQKAARRKAKGKRQK